MLFATGGKLNFTNYYWYLVKWKWTADGFSKILSHEKLPASLSLTPEILISEIQVKRMQLTGSLKTLGVWTSPSGSTDHQFQRLSTILINITTNIKSSTMTPRQASLIIPVYLHSK